MQKLLLNGGYFWMFIFFSFMFANIAAAGDSEGTVGWSWVYDVTGAIQSVLWPILIIVGAAGMIYAIVLGINIARADSTDKREEAKQRLIHVIIGLAVIVALILFFQLLITPGGILDQIFPEFADARPPVKG
ncbi:MAG: hypothetical protein IKT27_06090 [Clostridia bacterium]|nr:hypothetical protein [Clostridia bacterium]